MKFLLAATAAIAPLLATGAFAQSVSDEVNKQLWCGTAFIAYFDGATELDAEMQAIHDGAVALVDSATAAHIEAGYSAEQTDKIKADLVVAITQQFTDGTTAHSPEECLTLLPPPPAAEAPADTPSSEAQ
jgi:hypothetical protein